MSHVARGNTGFPTRGSHIAVPIAAPVFWGVACCTLFQLLSAAGSEIRKCDTRHVVAKFGVPPSGGSFFHRRPRKRGTPNLLKKVSPSIYMRKSLRYDRYRLVGQRVSDRCAFAGNSNRPLPSSLTRPVEEKPTDGHRSAFGALLKLLGTARDRPAYIAQVHLTTVNPRPAQDIHFYESCPTFRTLPSAFRPHPFAFPLSLDTRQPKRLVQFSPDLFSVCKTRAPAARG